MSETVVVCEREFKTERDGAVVPIIVRWRLPQKMPTGEWRCDYEIVVDGVSYRRSHAYGVDSVQALHLSMIKAASCLYTFQTPVFWSDPDDDLGLPTADVLDDIRAQRAERRLSRDG